jgi:hypothetical protein
MRLGQPVYRALRPLFAKFATAKTRFGPLSFFKKAVLSPSGPLDAANAEMTD